MAHGSRETLEQELEALLRQRDQYSLALDAATDPQASIRLQRTLERLDDEVEGLREALAALPVMSTEIQPPDWEDEPATAIFDPDVMPPPSKSMGGDAPSPPSLGQSPPEPPTPPALARSTSSSRGVASRRGARTQSPPPTDAEEITEPVPAEPVAAFDAEANPSAEKSDPARPLYDLDDELRRARESGIAPSVRVPSLPVGPSRRDPTPAPTRPRPAFVPEPGAAEPLPVVDPTISVTPPAEPGISVDAPTIALRRVPPRMPGRPYPDPLGPVVLDALEPPTGENPKEDDEPPSDPFALPGAGSGAAWPSHASASADAWGQAYSATPVDDSSPFGSTAVAPAAFDASSDMAPEGDWSAGSKIALALVVVGFLVAVGWVLTQ